METTLLIHDALGRLHGDGLPCRPRLGARRARITVGAPLSVNDHYGIRLSFEAALG